jgi:hypothetical protein
LAVVERRAQALHEELMGQIPRLTRKLLSGAVALALGIKIRVD